MTTKTADPESKPPSASFERSGLQRSTKVSINDKRIDLVGNIPFALAHLGCLLAIWSGVSWTAIAVCFFLYYARMFGVTAGYHRYFSHSSFKTSRPGQFLLACLAMSSAQMGPLWWAGHHRCHHKYSDTEDDAHTPVLRGFWWAHVGWIMSNKNARTKVEMVPDLAKFSELVFLDRHYTLPPIALAATLYFLGWILERSAPGLHTSGFQLITWGFFISTVLLYHGTFSINSLAHVVGSRRFETGDRSRNNFWLALITMGEGWHNNHHRFPYAERQGLYWWEIDMTHYILSVLASVGLVWDVRRPRFQP